MNSTKDTFFLSLARVFSILWVILIQHNFAPYSSDWGWVIGGSYDLFNASFRRFTSVFTPLSMPIVFCVAGFLFKYKHEEEGEFLPFIMKKIRRLLIPCYVLGVLFALLKDHSLSIKVLYGYAHLWFIFDLFVIFFITKFVYCFFPNISVVIHCLIIICGMIVSVIMNTGYGLVSSYLFFTLGYVLCCLLDYLLRYTRLLLVVCIAGFVVKFLFRDCISGQFLSTAYAVLMLYPCMCMFYVLSKYPFFKKPWFKFLNCYSYGLYLFHMFFLYMFYIYLNEYNSFLISNSCWISTTIAISTIPMSIYVTYLVRKLGIRFI